MALIQKILGLGFFLSLPAWACAVCGLNQSFTPTMLLISTGFVVLPLGFVGFIAWRLWKDSKFQAQQRMQRLEQKTVPTASASKT